MDNQNTQFRRNDRPWLKTYEKFGMTYDIEMPPANTSLIEIFEESFVKHKGRISFVCMNQELSFDDLDTYSKNIGAYLQSLGLKKGVGSSDVQTSFNLQFVSRWNPCRLHLSNVNPLYTTHELEHQLRDSDTKALILLENFAKTYVCRYC